MPPQRPQLGTFASPTNQLVTPIQSQVAPVDEQGIRDSYAFANAFGELSQSMVQVASAIKMTHNKESVEEGERLVNASRKTYQQLVTDGQISMGENPWFHIGAQNASGTLEAAKARAEFQMDYDLRVAQNPELMQDNAAFDVLAADFATKKSQQFGTTQTLRDSFFEAFNPYLVAAGAQHAAGVVEYRKNKLLEVLSLSVDASLSVGSALFDPRMNEAGKRDDGSQKDRGWLGEPMFDPKGNVITERETVLEVGDPRNPKLILAPMIVPGLPDEDLFNLTQNNADFDDLSSKAQVMIYAHAAQKLREGKSPFFASPYVQDVSQLQADLDARGRELGLPRVANLSVTAHLIEVMSKGADPWKAEAIFNQLRAGTGLLKDVTDVKVLMTAAAPAIEKNKFDRTHARQEEILNILTARVEVLGNMDPRENDIRVQLEDFMSALEASTTFSTEEKGKALDRFHAQFTAGQQRGLTHVTNNEKNDIRRVVAETYARGGEDPVRNYDATLAAFNSEAMRMGHYPGTAGYAQLKKDMMPVIESGLQQKLTQYAKFIVEQTGGTWDPNTPESPAMLELFEIKPSDSPRIKALKEGTRLTYKLNVLQAGISFDLPERLKAFRAVALTGISSDVERGVRSDLKDLVRMYQSNIGGRAPLDILFGGTDVASQRTKLFLESTSRRIDSGMGIDDAIRDATQELNMSSPLSANALVDIKVGSEAFTDIQDSRKEAVEARLQVAEQDLYGWWASWGPFAPTLNGDSAAVATNLFNKAYLSTLAETMSHDEAVEAGSAAIANTMFVRGSLLPREPLEAVGLSAPYLAVFVDLEVANYNKATGAEQSATMVQVDTDGYGKPVFALRTKDGFYIADRTYSIEDLSSNEKPVQMFDDAGNRIISESNPKGLSPRELVTQELAKRLKAVGGFTDPLTADPRAYALMKAADLAMEPVRYGVGATVNAVSDVVEFATETYRKGKKNYQAGTRRGR